MGVVDVVLRVNACYFELWSCDCFRVFNKGPSTYSLCPRLTSTGQLRRGGGMASDVSEVHF